MGRARGGSGAGASAGRARASPCRRMGRGDDARGPACHPAGPSRLVAAMSVLAKLTPTTRLALWGYGREGQATRAFLATAVPGLVPTLVADTPPETAIDLPTLTGEAGRTALARGRFEIVVKSPGISLYRPEVEAMRQAGTRLTSSTNLWFERQPGRTVLAVTGTKGKSTTASLIAHLWPGAILAGNVGKPLIAVPEGKAPLVLELSSYQCADLAHAPTAMVLTNLYPEHLDWHLSRERYFADKLRLVDLAPTAVLNAKDARTVERFQGLAKARWFETDAGWHVQGGVLHHGAEPRWRMADWPLPGVHNLTNLAAALTALEVMGQPSAAALRSAERFTGLAHRLQVVAVSGGVTWVDDSISTTPESAAAALAAFAGRPVTLVLGGQDRGQDVTPLATAIRGRDVRILTLPDNGPAMAAALTRTVPDLAVVPCADLVAAITAAAALTPSGGVVLLSPAAPSYGHFRNFEERGERFATLARRAPPPQ
ncbi:MAG: UDP-N-acetylmuramoyl-L-alanine--D-glutamate ligase [Geminicoccaceae bacterium]|nr:MAG: UDP-N-acetylmuramoyl-L-alanine--D-glutamate ligase [Geminicoccaceae bacterium]